MMHNLALELQVGDSLAMQALRRRIIQLSKYRYSILFTGAAGSGKTSAARAIHSLSARGSGPFIIVDCECLFGTLFEAQVFGHAESAFKFARGKSMGSLVAAQGGTIFLKNIDHLCRRNQQLLFDALSKEKVKPVGADTECASNDIRVMASTRRNLLELVTKGAFSPELYYSVAATRVLTKELKERKEDIRPLLRHFIAKNSVECGLPNFQLSAGAFELLQSYHWPENIGELEAVVENAVLNASSDVLGPWDFSAVLTFDVNESIEEEYPELESVNSLESIPVNDVVCDKWATLHELEANHLRNTLRETLNDLDSAAKLLGIERDQLQKKMEKHNIAIDSKLHG